MSDPSDVVETALREDLCDDAVEILDELQEQEADEKEKKIRLGDHVLGCRECWTNTLGSGRS